MPKVKERKKKAQVKAKTRLDEAIALGKGPPIKRPRPDGHPFGSGGS